MTTSRSEGAPYKTVFSDGIREAYADASVEKGGSNSGFGPHRLLEASVACCITIWLRMYADKHSIPLRGVTAKVSLNRETASETIFEYGVELEGPLNEDQRQDVLRQAKLCPVCQTLSRRISFHELPNEAQTLTTPP
jgi:putative redox protein